MPLEEEYPPTRPSSPTMFESTTPEGSPGQKPSPSTAQSAMQTPVFSESTTPVGSPQAGASTPGYDMTELSPPRFLLGRKPVQDTITAAGPSTPRSPTNGDHDDDQVPSSSPGDVDRDALPSRSRPNSLGSAQALEQLPSRHGPGARMVQLPEVSSRQHRRSNTMNNMPDDLPGPLFARASSPVPSKDGPALPEQTAGENIDEDPFVGTPLAHLSRGYRPVYETSPTIPGPSTQTVSTHEFVNRHVPETNVQPASSTESVDSDGTIEDETLYTGHVQKNSSSPKDSPDRKKGLGLFSDRAGDYDLALGHTFFGAPLDPEQMSENEVRLDYPLDEINGGEGDGNVGVYDFAYCAGQAPQTERQWETVQVWEPLYANHPWPLLGMPLEQILNPNNSTVIVEMDDLNMEDETVQEVYQESFKALVVRDSEDDAQEEAGAEVPDIVDHDSGSIGEGDDERSSEHGLSNEAEQPGAHTTSEDASPTIPADTATPGSATHSASAPLLGEATPEQFGQHKRTTWACILQFFCLHRSRNDKSKERKGFWHQLDRFKVRKE